MNNVIIFIIVFVIFLVLFLIFYKPFGGIPSKNDMKDYSKRSSIFNNNKFFGSSSYTKWDDLYRDRSTGKGVKPKEKLSVQKFSYVSNYDMDDVLVTWFGHSTVLIQMHGLNILVDPIFSNVASPIFIGPKRFSDLPCSIDDLPDIDVVIITHEHYDHLDYKSIKKLNKKTGRFIVPLGVEKDLERFGVDGDRITNMAWWEEINIDGLTIAFTPSSHFSGRFILDSGKALWSSFVLKDEYNTIFDSGDTGYDDHFKDIHEKYSVIDFALLDSSQYNVKWHSSHMFPEESVSASIDLGAKVSMPVHWGAFVLSNHSWDDPVSRFVMMAREKGVNYMMPRIGETVSIKDYKKYQDDWWKNIN